MKTLKIDAEFLEEIIAEEFFIFIKRAMYYKISVFATKFSQWML
jgi:hypothetical protein